MLSAINNSIQFCEKYTKPVAPKAREIECPTVNAVMSNNNLRHSLKGNAKTSKVTKRI